MKIVFIIDRLWNALSGTENQLLKLIRGLGPRHEVHLVCLRSTPWLEAEGASLPCQIAVFRIDGFRHAHSYANIVALWRYLRHLRPDVVHTFFPVANIVGVVVARLAGISMVISSRRDFGEWMQRRYLWLTRLANLLVSHIVTNSAEVRQLTVRVEGFPAERIDVIPNAIDLDEFAVSSRNEVLRSRLEVPRGGKLVGLIANYRPMKRQETLVHAARQIVDQRDDIRFVLVGANADREDLQAKVGALIAELGLRGHVHQMHADGGIAQVLAAIDIGVNCSQGEGLSNAVMECMAARVPCIVAASGGNTDLVTDGETGMTFELDNATELARKIMQLADDPVSGARLADAALLRLRTEMSLNAVIDRFDRYYADLSRAHPVVAGALPG